MLRKLLFTNFLIGILLSNSYEETIFKYSNQTIQSQPSSFSFHIHKTHFLDYSISFLPSSNLVFNIKSMEDNKDENNFFYSLNLGFIFKTNILRITNKNIFGIGINELKFDSIFNKIKWNSYFLINELHIKSWHLNTVFSYNFNNNFSLFNISNYLYKNVTNNFNFGVGFNMSKINDLIYYSYIGIMYNL